MKQYLSKETRYYNNFKEFLVDIANRYQNQTEITTYHKGTQIQ